jgi:hypothetical protein
MRPYSQISPRWWTGDTGRQIARRSLSECDSTYTAGLEVRVLGDWLMTGSMHNQYGLYYAPLVLIQAETGLRPSRVAAALETLAALEFASYDELTSFVWVREMAAWQLPLPLEREGRNGKPDHRIEAARRWYRGEQPNPFLGEFFDRYGEPLWLLERREMKGLARGFDVPRKGPVLSPSSVPALVAVGGKEPENGGPLQLVNGQLRTAALEVVALWNRGVREPFTAIAEAPASLGRVVAALHERPDIDAWGRMIAEVQASRWCAGDNPRGWVADFWWLLKSHEEVSSGRYRNRDAPAPKSKTQQRVTSNLASADAVKAALRAER